MRPLLSAILRYIKLINSIIGDREGGKEREREGMNEDGARRQSLHALFAPARIIPAYFR